MININTNKNEKKPEMRLKNLLNYKIETVRSDNVLAMN